MKQPIKWGRVPTKPLEGNALLIFNTIVSYMSRYNGRSPTNREIEAVTNIPVSVVNYHVNLLCEMGVLSKHDAGARNLNVVGSKWVYEVAG